MWVASPLLMTPADSCLQPCAVKLHYLAITCCPFMNISTAESVSILHHNQKDMRKRIIDEDPQNTSPVEGEWLDVKDMAVVEISSEDAAYPIEEALSISGSSGWRAARSGKQTIRIIFDEPQRINIIHLLFVEKTQSRTQEFVLRWSPANDQPYREIVRQQFNFSPGSTTEEQETYTVNLDGIKIVELTIVPDIGGGSAPASISSLWFA